MTIESIPVTGRRDQYSDWTLPRYKQP